MKTILFLLLMTGVCLADKYNDAVEQIENDWQCQEGYSYIDGDCEQELTFNENGVFDNLYIVTITPSHAMSFYDENNKEIGHLDFSRGKMIFKGNADKAAKVFFDFVIKQYAELKCVKDN